MIVSMIVVVSPRSGALEGQADDRVQAFHVHGVGLVGQVGAAILHPAGFGYPGSCGCRQSSSEPLFLRSLSGVGPDHPARAFLILLACASLVRKA